MATEPVAEQPAGGRSGGEREAQPPAQHISDYLVAAVERQLAESGALQRARERQREARGTETRATRRSGPTVVLTLRLGHAELDALEARAAWLGVPPRALARTLIRRGLERPVVPDLSAVVDDLQASVARLRQLVDR